CEKSFRLIDWSVSQPLERVPDRLAGMRRVLVAEVTNGDLPRPFVRNSGLASSPFARRYCAGDVGGERRERPSQLRDPERGVSSWRPVDLQADPGGVLRPGCGLRTGRGAPG